VGGPLRPEPKQRGTRVRVVVTVAALVATVGAVVGGVLLTNSPDGSGGGKASTDAAADPNVAVDPPSSPALGGSGAPGAGVVPSGSPTATLSVPAAPPTLSQAQAMASAQAAEGAFAPPTSVPSDVPSYSGSAPLGSVSLPPFLTVAVPPVQAKDGRAQALADQSTLLLKAWVEAWAGGSTGDARYRALCVEQCRAVLDPMVALWKNANIVPAGTLRFFNLAGGLAKGNDQSGEVGVCLDDSALTAFRDGATYQDPYPLGRPELLVFGLVYDKAVGHWVATEAYASPGDSYCAQDQSSGGTSG
jgi:hypothetical protein